MREYSTPNHKYLYEMVLKTTDENGQKLLEMLLKLEYEKGIDNTIKKARNNQKVIRHIIFTCDRNKGIKYIEEICKNNSILKIKDNRTEYVVDCLFDRYEILRPSESVRGNKCHYAHIDKDSIENNEDLLFLVIKPTATLEGCSSISVKDRFMYF